MGKYDLKLQIEVQLKRHVTAIHDGNNPFKCSICVERILQGQLDKLSLFTMNIYRSNVIDVVQTLHNKAVHEGKKLFKCNFCNRK